MKFAEPTRKTDEDGDRRIKLADLTPLNLRRLKSDPLKNGKVDGSALSHQSVAN